MEVINIMNPSTSIRRDDYNDYYIVMEQTSPTDKPIDIIKDTSNYIRFSTCLQSFNGRNRNRRLWRAEHIKQMIAADTVQEMLAKHSFVGEAGHPVPDTGKVTIERIVSIDPLRCSHRIVELSWPNEYELHGIVETLDEGPGTPGYRFYKNIVQGIIPAFSLRSLVPQRKNADGTTDVIGPGRMVCYDRVYLPSHKEAYQDVEIPVKKVVKENEFTTVMESYVGYVTSHSDKIRSIVDNMDPVMESAYMDPKSMLLTMKTGEGRVFIQPELKYRNEIRNIYNSIG